MFGTQDSVPVTVTEERSQSPVPSRGPDTPFPPCHLRTGPSPLSVSKLVGTTTYGLSRPPFDVYKREQSSKGKGREESTQVVVIDFNLSLTPSPRCRPRSPVSPQTRTVSEGNRLG